METPIFNFNQSEYKMTTHKLAIRALAVCLIFVTSALNAAPNTLDPPQINPEPVKIYISPKLPTFSDKFGAQTDIPNSYFGVSSGGGSLALGVILGAVGVLINQSAIQSENIKAADSASSLSSLNLADYLRDADGATQVTGGHQPGDFVLLPAARLFVRKDNKFLLTCILKAEYEGTGSKPWVAYYQVNSDGTFSLDEPTSKIAMQDGVRACLLEAKQLFLAHVRGDLGIPSEKKVKLSDLTLTMPVYTAILPKQVVGNDGRSVQRFRNSDVLSVE